MSKPIYTLSAHSANGHTSRTFGYYHDYNDAVLAAEDNRGQMHEGLYEWLVIEEITEGIHASAMVMRWYSWRDGCWLFSAAPQWSIGVVNHACIG